MKKKKDYSNLNKNFEILLFKKRKLKYELSSTKDMYYKQ